MKFIREPKSVFVQAHRVEDGHVVQAASGGCGLKHTWNGHTLILWESGQTVNDPDYRVYDLGEAVISVESDE
jgi:hypothetical protein